MRLRSVWYRIRETQWRRFFAVNGPREWKHIRFTGFRHLHDDIAQMGQWIGMTNTGDHYYMSVKVSDHDLSIPFGPESHIGYIAAKVEHARAMLDRFLLPECRCRVGFHWKCSIHRKWVN